MTEPIVWLGRDHSRMGQVSAQPVLAGAAAIGISVGRTRKPNEDAISVAFGERELVLTLADGHWGARASELVVEHAARELLPAGRTPTVGRLPEQFYDLCSTVNLILYEEAQRTGEEDSPETTVVLAYLTARERTCKLEWASFGDSFLYRHTGQVIGRMNELRRHWLGFRYSRAEQLARAAQATLPSVFGELHAGLKQCLDVGSAELSAGETLLLCSDGLIDAPGDSELPDEMIGLALESKGSAHEQVVELLQLALTKGGTDNIACAVVDVERLIGWASER